jgi:hypothetical protein
MTMDFRLVTRAAAAIAGTVMLAVPAVTHAQGQGYGRVSGSIEQLYDSNLFAVSTSLEPQSDWITRFGPLFEAGYRSEPLNLRLQYGFDAEKHRDLVELDSVFARQNASTTLNYKRRAFAADLSGEFVRTQSPTDLNIETLRFVGYSPAQRVGSSEAFTFELSQVTSLKVDHTFTRDSVVGGIKSLVHTARLGFSRRLSERTSIRADYRPGLMDFSNGRQERHHVGTFGVVHAFTPALDIEVDGGVRSTSGDIDPEILALMRHRMRHGALSLRYQQTRETTIGEGSSLQLKRLGAEVNYTPTRAMEFMVSPTRATSGGTLSRDVVYLIDIQSRFRATRRWSILAFGRFGQQQRTLPTSDEINYRTVSVKTVVTLGNLEREREDAETETR